MVVKNEAQFAERVKLTLNRWIEAHENLKRDLLISSGEDDEMEWTEEEKESGSAYFELVCLESLRDNEIHVSSTDNLGLIAKVLNLAIKKYTFDYEGSRSYEAVIEYNGYIFFCLVDPDEMSELYSYGVEVIDMHGERSRV